VRVLFLADLRMYSILFGFNEAYEIRDDEEKKVLHPGDMTEEDIEEASPIIPIFCN
jgi:hypothetical protein